MLVNSPGVEFPQTISKFRMSENENFVAACLRNPENEKLGIFKS